MDQQLSTLTGVGHIMVTPFASNESIDEASLRRMVDTVCTSGAQALITLGIMGEAHRLTDAERAYVIRTVVEQAAGRVLVIAGATAESTIATISRTAEAHSLGADAVMIAAPRAATTADLQLAHFERVAATAEIPIVLQDEPVTTGVVMTAASIAKIYQLDQVQTIKVEQVPSPTKVSQILAAAPGARCFGGLGGLYLVEELDRGAVGIMTGFAMPEILVEICSRYQAGDVDGAREIFFHWLPLIRYEAQLGVGGVAIRKQLLTERGIIATSMVRGPVGAPDPLAVGELRSLLATLRS